MNLILGANGQLGWELTQCLPDVQALTREDLDVTRLGALRDTIVSLKPSAVINCTAYNAVDKAEVEPDLAMELNDLVPGTMAFAAREVGAKFYHFSTDYVFGDHHTSPINESHAPAPLAAYARSKAAGERRVFQNHPGAVVMRLTGVYSDRRHNFIKTMLKHAEAGNPLKVVNDQFISPTWARPIARTVSDLLQRDLPGGPIHCVAAGGCTWFELAQRLFELKGIEADLSPVAQADWAAPACRPSYSVLDNAVLRTLGANQHMIHWDTMLAEFLASS